MMLDKKSLVKKVGVNIRTYRRLKNISLTKLALESGIDYTQVSRIERGMINTSIYHIYILSKTLDVPLAVFFHEVDNRTK